MNFYQRHVVPRLVHLAMRQEVLLPFRRLVISAAEGRVLEVGIGSGLNLPLYGTSVHTVIGLEPSPELLRMAQDRAATAPTAVELLEASAEAVPLDAASIDTVVTTWTAIADNVAQTPIFAIMITNLSKIIFIQNVIGNTIAYGARINTSRVGQVPI